MNKILLIITLCLFFNQFISFSQKKTSSYIKDGNYYFNEDDFNKALISYFKVLESDSLNANLNYKVGLCYLNMPLLSDNFKSIPYFEKASLKTTNNYRYNSNNEKNAPLDIWYFLGNAYKQKFDFVNAEKCYDYYLNNVKTKRNNNIEYVKREKSSINIAKQMILFPKELKKDSLSISFEKTEEIQSCPVISKDGNILIFCMGKNNIFPPDFKLETSTSDYKMDKIFISNKVNGLWQKPENIMSKLHAKDLTIPTSISPDGKTLYLVCDDNDNGNIYYSDFKNGSFVRMKKLGKNINSRYWESHASISEDGNFLYFTSDKPRGYGGLDIYVSEKKNNGEWGISKNLGSIINTSFDEETPFIVDNGKTLYFSSEGHFNMGGFDIFCSINEDSTWSKPLNIGYPINTVGNDLVYLPKIDSAYAYAPLNRYGLHDRAGTNNDLYFRQNPNKTGVSEYTITGDLKLNIKNIKKADFTTLVIQDSSTNTSNSIKIDFTNNNYQINIPSGIHKLTYNLSGFKPVIKTFDFPPLYGFNHILVDILFEPTEEFIAQVNKSDSILTRNDTITLQTQTSKLEIRNVLFAFDKNISHEYQSDFDSLACYLKKYQEFTICLTGFTDDVGDSEYNLRLSKRRVLYVKERLVALSVKNNIQIKWEGEENPIATNNTKAGRALNRRVEIKVL